MSSKSADEGGDTSPSFFSVAPVGVLIDKHRSLHYPYRCIFGDARLDIDEGVFCPTLTKASPLLLESVEFKPGQRVLDVFAGCGAFGINAALNGATAVTVDISPIAVACAERNAALNNVEDRVDVRTGTMRTCVAEHERFDLILANPPLLPGQQTDSLSMSVFDPELRATIDFIRLLNDHLTENGHCYLLTSDVIERYGYDVDRLCIENGLMSSIAAKLDVGYETYRVHDVVRHLQISA